MTDRQDSKDTTIVDVLRGVSQATDDLRARHTAMEAKASRRGKVAEWMSQLQRAAWVRRVVVGAVVLGFLALIGFFVWRLSPGHDSLTMSGGDILGNRHQLAMAMRDGGSKVGLHINVRPIAGTFSILDAVDSRSIDAAFIQGGLDAPRPNVRHVARIIPETLHLLVRDDVKSLSDLKGRTVNMGSAQGGTRIVGEQVLAFSDLRAGVDYVPSAYNAEQLLALPEAKLPDAVLNIATVPSFLAEELIRSRGFGLLEIPFPKALALRHGWVANVTILPYTYRTAPPVPETEIQSLGVDLFLVAHRDVPARAVVKLLDLLYSPGVRNAMRMDIDPNTVALPSGYPHSEGTDRFLQRNEPLFSQEDFERLTTLSGLLLSGLTFIVMGVRFLRSRSGGQVTVDKEYQSYLDQAVGVNKWLANAPDAQDPVNIRKLSQSMLAFRTALLERSLQVKSANVDLMDALQRSMDMTEARLSCLGPTGLGEHET